LVSSDCRYKLDAIAPTNKTAFDPRITAMYTKVTELVGIGEAKEEVIARLTKGDADDHKERIVVSIAGFGGLGKTTLAKAVYDEIKDSLIAHLLFLCLAILTERNFSRTSCMSFTKEKDILVQIWMK
jgi:ATP-dependent protease ClpP protease subunit